MSGRTYESILEIPFNGLVVRTSEVAEAASDYTLNPLAVRGALDELGYNAPKVGIVHITAGINDTSIADVDRKDAYVNTSILDVTRDIDDWHYVLPVLPSQRAVDYMTLQPFGERALVRDASRRVAGALINIARFHSGIPPTVHPIQAPKTLWRRTREHLADPDCLRARAIIGRSALTAGGILAAGHYAGPLETTNDWLLTGATLQASILGLTWSIRGRLAKITQAEQLVVDNVEFEKSLKQECAFQDQKDWIRSLIRDYELVIRQ